MRHWSPIGVVVLAAMTGGPLGCGGPGQESSPTQPAVSQMAIEDDGVVTRSGVEKVTICHIPPGNPDNAHTITVGAPAVPAHIAEHGDTIGPCPEPTPTPSPTPSPTPLTAHLIVIKHVINDEGGSATAGDFLMTIMGVTAEGGNTFPGAEAPGTDKTLSSVGSYEVSETGPSGYDPTYSADCTGTIAAGETKTCTVTNTYVGS